MKSCARCKWQIRADDRDDESDALAAHAKDAKHPLCVVCGESLPEMFRQTCPECVAKVRVDLADIESLYVRLPGFLVESRFPSDTAGERTSGTREKSMPGGDALTLYAYGGTGMDAGVYAPGTSWHENRDHVSDENPGDPPSVVATLEMYEDEWRHLLRQPAAGPPNVATSIAYLTSQLDRMAQAHSEFEFFAHDIHGLVQRLKQVVGLSDQPVPGAGCLDCGTQLERKFIDVVRDGDGRIIRGGLEDDYTCPRCHRVYTKGEYLLAIRGALECDGWVPVSLAAAVVGSPPETVRTWVHRAIQDKGGVPAACRVKDRAVLVWWPAVHERMFKKKQAEAS